ncbi:ubiquinone anaerobic biosynthesis accessory factor UbiT [Pelagibacterium limicola]|uniref:ubiquinone anaerobic biosynthesis accessory factor UbiT n=1 Tax=Pelagibacterium limicola TaxID=2791022 RepID=UPI0018AFECAD|nr:SCP2 sterol-binding domain-containing protein [Pelagibacterium limicola]
MSLPAPLAQALAMVPARLAAPAADWAFNAVLGRHPLLLDRMGKHASASFLIKPTDLPHGFLLHPDKHQISVVKGRKMPKADVTISGPILTLLALLEGRLDGDAAFFSRKLSIEGDTEAVLALRNAIDDAALDLPTELSAQTGPFAPAIKRLLERIRSKALGKEGGAWN